MYVVPSRALSGAAAVAACFVLVSCSGGPADNAAAAKSDLPPAPVGTASLRGTIRFLGTPPAREAVRSGSADPSCHKSNDGKMPLLENVVVNENGSLRNVIIFVKEGLPAGSYAITTSPAVLNQSGCVYEPHVLSLQTDQPLRILNSDDTVHNVNGQGKVNERFNFSMINDKVPPKVKAFPSAEYPPFKIKCDVHPWMLSWAAVFPHPYHAVTGIEGTFEIAGLPAGEYTVETWQEEFGTQQHKVTLGDGESKELDLSYPAPAGAK